MAEVRMVSVLCGDDEEQNKTDTRLHGVNFCFNVDVRQKMVTNSEKRICISWVEQVFWDVFLKRHGCKMNFKITT